MKNVEYRNTLRQTKKPSIDLAVFAEHVISIICSLLKNCRSAQHERLLNKFIENEHEKVDRIMELHFKYSDKVRQAEREIEIEYMDVSHRYCYMLPLKMIRIYFPVVSL